MKKTLSIVVVVFALVIIIGGVYVVSQPAPSPVSDVGDSEAIVTEQSSDPKNATYSIGGESVTLVDGRAEQAAAPGASVMVVTQYFGNEVRTDLNNDGREDVVFLLTQSTGGTGIFYYAVAALDTENGWVGSEGFYLGDRIAPQTTEISSNPNHQQVVVINYAERALDQAMTEAPSVGKSVWIKLDVNTMMFGEVMKDVEGEANPESMTLDMKPWTWVKTTYNNDIELVPQQADAFTLTFTNEGSVSATTDCNAMSGTYAVTENQISFGPMAATRMFCQDSQEQEFAAMLAETQSFFFTAKGELVLELKLDSGSAMFR